MFASCQLMGMNLGFPDVCLTPVPVPTPVPYPNIVDGRRSRRPSARTSSSWEARRTT